MIRFERKNLRLAAAAVGLVILGGVIFPRKSGRG